MFFFCADLWSANVFSMPIILIDRWQVLSYLIRMRAAVEPSSSRNLTEIVVYKYSAHCFSLDFGDECFQRRKESLFVFVLDFKTKEDDKIVCKVWASKLAESDKGSYYNQEKWLKEDKASEKPIETTAK